MKNKAPSYSIDTAYSIDWVEEIIDQVRHDIYAGLVDRATGSVKTPRYKIDRSTHPNIVNDDRIEIPRGREKLLERCLLLLLDRREPAMEEEDIAFFLQMNFKGFGDKPNKRMKLKYKMKPTHLMYFFRLVFNAVYAYQASNTELQAFRNAVAQSFVDYDSVKPDTIVTYFNKKRPSVEEAYANIISRITAEYI